MNSNEINEMSLLPGPPLVSLTSSRSRTVEGRSTTASASSISRDQEDRRSFAANNNTVRQRRFGGASNSINDDDDEKRSLSTRSIANNDAASSSMSSSSSYRCSGGSIALGGPPAPERIVEDDKKLAKMMKGVVSCSSSNSNDGTAASVTSSPPSSVYSSAAHYNFTLPIPVAVLLWYLLGVLSITSSKILLSPQHYDTSPLLLTAQQLTIGALLLKCVLGIQKNHHRSSSSCCQKVITTIDHAKANRSSNSSSSNSSRSSVHEGQVGISSSGNNNSNSSNNKTTSGGSSSSSSSNSLLLAGGVNNKHLFLTALYFALGFLFTNYGFQSGTTVFVETIKAGEPITSSIIAVLYGIETLDHMEVVSLFGIVSGVVLSTVGSSNSSSSSSSISSSKQSATSTSLSTLIVTCLIVMASNVCFSFRGLYQKLFRLTQYGNTSQIDDITLQYNMQLIGATLLVLPATLVLYFGGGSSSSTSTSNIIGMDDDIAIYNHHHHPHHHALPVHRHLHDHHPSLMTTATSATTTVFFSMEYALLSLANGIAFASYNLASTYILSRISVIHHAALNCIRRIFAIVVTSIIFSLVITSLQVVGILIAMAGFVSYVHYKSQKEGRIGRRKALRAKYGNVILTHGDRRKRTNGYGRSSNSSSLTASYLPTINPLANNSK